MHLKPVLLSMWIALACSPSFLTAQDQPTEDSIAKAPHATDALGESIDIPALARELAHADVVFLGEQHDNDSGHQFQLNVIQALVDNGHDVVVSMEQFERDVQGVVDDYLADRINEEAFLANSRPWRNYKEHYRPIVELAKKHRLPILAGNAPRKLASMIAANDSPMANQEACLPRSTTAPEDDYWHRFVATMKGHVGADGDEKMKSFYAAQCVKDDAMAEAITDYLSTNPHGSKLVVHLCGHFHSDYGLGTAARVVQRIPLARICVITMESIDQKTELQSDEMRVRAHYFFWATENEKNEKN